MPRLSGSSILLQQHARIDDAAGAEDAKLPGEDARGQVPELEGLAVDDDGVAAFMPGRPGSGRRGPGSCASRSTIFLSSSPHCAPTITVAGTAR